LDKKIWTLVRIATFIIIGLLNTIMIRPEDAGSFKNYIGYILLMIAAVDISVFLIKLCRKNPNKLLDKL
jgi:uncharacterized membrane protein YfhO